MNPKRDHCSESQINPVEHTADAGFIIKGRDTGELFLNSLKALYLLMDPRQKSKEFILKKISLEAPSTEELLVLWLNELIFLAEQKKIVVDKIGISIDGNKLEAELKLSEGGINGEVKAATYHDLSIKKDKHGYCTKIFFDL
ncbi:MAG: archease [Candidatus Aureabacteria bacterium]|nr:archease [Candidatus Auribacterota bacterium]